LYWHHNWCTDACNKTGILIRSIRFQIRHLQNCSNAILYIYSTYSYSARLFAHGHHPLASSQYRIWRVKSAGILRRVDRWISTDVSEAQIAPIFGVKQFILKMWALRCFETSVNIYQSKRPSNPEDDGSLITSLQEPTVTQDTNSFVVFDVNYVPFAHPNTRYIYGSIRHSNGRETETYKRTSLQLLIPDWGRNVKLIELATDQQCVRKVQHSSADTQVTQLHIAL